MDYTNSKTAHDKKDYWRTAPNAIYDAKKLLGITEFAIDAAATDYSVAVCGPHISENDNALAVENWFNHGFWDSVVCDPYPVAWCNPPFSRKSDFLKKAHEQAKNGFIMMMLPFSPATSWWRSLITGKATAVYVPDGRYNFLDPISGIPAPGSKFPTCFVLFSPLAVDSTKWVEFERTTEKKFAGMVDRQSD